jgi:hypothetical protein
MHEKSLLPRIESTVFARIEAILKSGTYVLAKKEVYAQD